MLRKQQRTGMRFAQGCYVAPEGPTHKTTADALWDHRISRFVTRLSV